jgi:HAD superfamily hydrolase (TIGR01549 family)
VKTLWVREPYLDLILAGRKTIEVRVGYENIRHLQPGDQLKLNERHVVTIKRVGRYRNFEEMLAHEDLEAIAPGPLGQDDPGGDPSSEELLLSLRRIYPPEKEALGVIALAFAVPRRYDAVFFDMGYTLVYFEPIQEAIVQEALRTIGVVRSIEEIDAAVRAVWGEYFRDAETIGFPATREHDRETQDLLASRLFESLNAELDEKGSELYSDYVESRFRQPGVIRPYPEVVEVLSALRERGYRLGIISNWSWNLRDRVALAGLESWFELIWASAYAGYNKPHPNIFRQALDELEAPTVEADRVLYVGDSYRHDVVGARNAGMDVVLIDRDGTSDAEDCTVIRDLRELLGILKV